LAAAEGRAGGQAGHPQPQARAPLQELRRAANHAPPGTRAQSVRRGIMRNITGTCIYAFMYLLATIVAE